ncbi:MAG: hypothetical protein D6721_08800 [Gammaproteobacteria bacterium]|nr:MAG: hypothetical protein D6721_08800 [Gammaproteobacteria bacterium]
MADLFSVTAPLQVRLPDGTRHILAERFPLKGQAGLVYFEVFWHFRVPAASAIHRIEGEIRGEGPWKVGEAVFTLVGCQGTDPEMATLLAEWRDYLAQGAPGYPDRDRLLRLAEAAGAEVSR